MRDISDTVLSFLGYCAALIGASFGLLQLRHTLRTRTTAGVSGLWWLALSANTGFWLAYGVVTAIPQQVLANAPAFVMLTTLGWFLASDRRAPRLVAVLTPALMLSAGLVANMVTLSVMVPIGFAFSVLIGLPQLLVSLRSPESVGVSTASWVAGSMAGLCWLTYGLGAGDLAVVTATTPGLVLSALNVWALKRPRPVPAIA